MPDIKNIIFDFGGVIINIDTSRVGQVLADRGIDNLDNLHIHLLGNNIYFDLETGRISAGQFREEIKSIVGAAISDREIDDAWNAIILDIPAERVAVLEELRKHYRTFLLSNTNIIHYDYYNRYFAEAFGYENLAGLFDRAYFSHQMGMRKPDPAIYEKVLADNGLIPGETLFIDDNRENVEAARALGIQGYHLDQGKELIDLFRSGRLAVNI